MSCSTPIRWEDLVAYWANDLPATEAASLEEHLMSCGACSAQSERVAAVTEALRALIPPIVSRATLTRLQARGMRLLENSFVPGRQEVAFPPDVDLLVHRLTGFDLSGAVRVRVAVRVESTGELLVEEPSAAFDPGEGVLIACQRHFAEFPPDVCFEVTACDASGAERVATYSIPHVFPG